MKNAFIVLCLLVILPDIGLTNWSGESVDVLIRMVMIGRRSSTTIVTSFEEYEKICNTTNVSTIEEDILGYTSIDTIAIEDNIKYLKIQSSNCKFIYNCADGSISETCSEYNIETPVFKFVSIIPCSETPFFESTLAQDLEGNLYEVFEELEVIYHDNCTVEYKKTSGVSDILFSISNDSGSNFFSYNIFEIQESIFQIDNEKPRFTHVPAELTINCSDYNDQTIGQATATDDCSELSITYTDSDYLDCNNNHPSTIIRTWKATDDCGNMATAQTIINVLPDNNQPIDCEAVTLNEGYNNRLYIDNILAPNAIIKVFKESDYGHLQLVWSCTASCLPTESIVGLSDGDYRVDIRFFDDYWRPICQTIKRTRLGDGGNHEEEEEEEPNHGNTTTICNNIDITSTNKYITISGMGDNAADVKVFDANWNPVFTCLNGDCQNPIQIDNVSPGKYFILFKLYQRGAYNSYTLVCDELVEVEVGGNTIAPLIAAAEEKQLPQLQDFQIAPNPANDYLHLGLKKYRGEAVQIRMYNQLGNPVMERAIENVQNDLEYISLKDFDNGVYFIRVEHPKYRAVTKRVVVARMY